jgi:hypothetical protein
MYATVPNWQFGSGSGLEHNWICSNELYAIKKPNHTEPTIFWTVPYFCKSDLWLELNI